MSTSAVASTRNQPTNKSWELSLYELHRQPQPAITDDTGALILYVLFFFFVFTSLFSVCSIVSA